MAPTRRQFPVEGDPEVLVSTSEISDAIRRLVKRGDARRIGPRLYTTNLDDDPGSIIRRNIWEVVAGYFPCAVISDRTAIEGKPSERGDLYVVHDRVRPVELPGLRVVPRAGSGPLPGDMPFIEGLYMASRPRALLENMRPSRARGGRPSRTLSRAELEEWLDARLSERDGEERVNELRDQARALAPQLGLQEEFGELDALIGALMGTRGARVLTPAGQARSAGIPVDSGRVKLFDQLADHLSGLAPVDRPPPSRHDVPVFAFFESYFSNFIEGTEFGLEEAERIVFDGLEPAGRPADAHDIWGVFKLAADSAVAGRVPTDPDSLVAQLREWRRIALAGRPEVEPGEFKKVNNRVGAYDFVSWGNVEGTLREAFRRSRNLVPGFARAAYWSFVISEVHPFTDGNGRISRLMMNAELTAAGQQRIIIPTVYLDNYLAALRALSAGRPEVLPRILDFAQRYSRLVDFSSLEAARADLSRTHAFLTEAEAEAEGVRLVLP